MGPVRENEDGLAARFAKLGVRNASVRTEIYAPIEPHTTGFLPVSDTHTLYWEESGNPEGQPIIFLHGGPGSGTSGGNRRFFDPDYYRTILINLCLPGACICARSPGVELAGS